MSEPTADELATRMDAFYVTRDDLRQRRRQLIKSAGEMPSELFAKAKAQLDEERQVWRAEGEELRLLLQAREQRNASLGYDPDFIQDPDRVWIAEEILAGINPEHWREGADESEG